MELAAIIIVVVLIWLIARYRSSSRRNPLDGKLLSDQKKAAILLGLTRRSIANMEAFCSDARLSVNDIAFLQQHIAARGRNITLLAKQVNGEKLDGREQISNYLVRNFTMAQNALSNEVGEEFGGSPERLIWYLKKIKSISLDAKSN